MAINTIESYRVYIAVSENKTRKKEANSRIDELIDEEAWKNALRLDTIADYIDYANKYIIHWSEAQSAIKKLRYDEDEQKWKRSCGDDSLLSYKKYL